MGVIRSIFEGWTSFFFVVPPCSIEMGLYGRCYGQALSTDPNISVKLFVQCSPKRGMQQ